MTQTRREGQLVLGKHTTRVAGRGAPVHLTFYRSPGGEVRPGEGPAYDFYDMGVESACTAVTGTPVTQQQKGQPR